MGILSKGCGGGRWSVWNLGGKGCKNWEKERKKKREDESFDTKCKFEKKKCLIALEEGI